jgi:hypothetical protein
VFVLGFVSMIVIGCYDVLVPVPDHGLMWQSCVVLLLRDSALDSPDCPWIFVNSALYFCLWRLSLLLCFRYFFSAELIFQLYSSRWSLSTLLSVPVVLVPLVVIGSAELELESSWNFVIAR